MKNRTPKLQAIIGRQTCKHQNQTDKNLQNYDEFLIFVNFTMHNKVLRTY